MEEYRLPERVGALESDMKNVVKALENVNSSLEGLNKQIQSNSKTNWSTLASWASVIIVVISCLGVLAIQPMKDFLERERFTNVRQYDQIQKLRARFEEERVRTHRVDQRVLSLENELREIKAEQRRRTSKVYKMSL